MKEYDCFVCRNFASNLGGEPTEKEPWHPDCYIHQYVWDRPRTAIADYCSLLAAFVDTRSAHDDWEESDEERQLLEALDVAWKRLSVEDTKEIEVSFEVSLEWSNAKGDK